MLITEHHDFLTEGELQEVWALCVCSDNWRFGQKSNNDTVYPMWFQGYYDTFSKEYKPGIPEIIVKIGDRFVDLIGEDYCLVRNMLAGNTFGQDGDIHDDWLTPNESVTGVLYLNRRWEDNWGGETIVYNEQNVPEISKFEAGKLITFDGSYPHIGKGPKNVENCVAYLQCRLLKLKYGRNILTNSAKNLKIYIDVKGSSVFKYSDLQHRSGYYALLFN